MDPVKLKVVELRAELSKRCLDTKGNKAVLVERLRQAMEDEKSEPKTHSESAQKSEQGSDSDDEGSESKSAEPAKLPPRTPSRSSRHRSREPTTPVRTPTRRSSSRSSASRQSPAKTTLAESLNEAAPVLEPIVEEDKSSPKKETVAPLPKKETAPVTPKKEITPTPSPKKDVILSPKKEATPEPSPKKETPAVTPKANVQASPKKDDAPVTPKKDTIVQNESPKLKKDDNLEIVKEAEKHVSEKSQEITRKSVDEICKKQMEKVNAQSPVKAEVQSSTKSVTQSPAKSTTDSPAITVPDSPAKTVPDSPAKSVPQSPIKSVLQSPAKSVSQSPAKSVAQSPTKSVPENAIETITQKSESQSPTKSVNQSSAKSDSPQKVKQSPAQKDSEDSPNKRFKSDENEPMDTEGSAEEQNIEGDDARMDQDTNQDKMETDEQQDDKDDSRSEKSEDRKRKRSPSPQEEAPRAPPIARPENEPNYDESAVLLSWYDSDLNLVIDTTNYFSGSPMQGDGFNYMWAGARTSHGFNKGKIFYEARINSEFNNIAAAGPALNTSGALPPDEEKIPSLLRVGWSTIGTSLQLGEDKLSYGFEGTGKKSTNKEFTEYGKNFAKDDIVGCYADFETDGNVALTYTINGESQGAAFVVNKEDLAGKALFPHILSKNCSFSINLGQEEHWSKEVLDGYQVAGKVDVNDRIAGPRRPEKREDCEVILLCGLPFSGKTSWALKHVAANPEKMYSVLGTHNLIERMTVDGAPLKDNFKGRWENVVEKCTRALTKLLDSAPSRRRNFILDQQANVYGSAQRRKMRNFYGFHRKAVILVPSDEEFKARIDKRKEQNDGEEIRESSILEVKANLSAPSVGESFEEVEWAELGEEEGKKLIETYNTQGKSAGYGQSQQQPNKRSRYDNGQKDRNRDNRDHRRSGYNDRRSSGAWRGGPGGGWRDGGRPMRGGPMRHGAGYGSGPAGWRGRGGSPLPPPRNAGADRRTGGNDRRQGNDRNRQSGRSGGWNAMGYQGNQHGNTGVWSNQGSWQGQGQSGWGGQQQQAWGGASAWKGYGANSYGQSQSQSGYGSQSQAGYGTQGASGYGNGNWGNNWGSQYYNQYWSGSGQQPAAGQTSGQTQATSGTSGQAASKK